MVIFRSKIYHVSLAVRYCEFSKHLSRNFYNAFRNIIAFYFAYRFGNTRLIVIGPTYALCREVPERRATCNTEVCCYAGVTNKL